MTSPDWPALLQRLLPEPADSQTIDWVEQAARRLPVIGMLESLGFEWHHQQRVLEAMPALVKIMQPVTPPNEALAINQAALTVGRCLEQRLPAIAVGPVAGILIQSYDAGRGLLSNALVHACAKGPQQDWQAFVTEVLRYDSPVHHTRRVAGEDLAIQNNIIKRGEKIVLVLAGANRDEGHFKNASTFDPGRSNNEDHLSFGAGPHACMAASFAVTMTASCLEYLFKKYRDIRVIDQQLTYEPLFNIRLIQKLLIRLTV
jgi:cytochrome P450